MRPNPSEAAKQIAIGSTDTDRRAWARRIMTKVRGGLRVPIAVREMAERALKAPIDEGNKETL